MAHHNGPGAATASDFAMFGNACRGKMAFPSKRQANGRLRVMRAKWQDNSIMNVYRCGVCYHWHFGHTPRHLRES